ncbi:hypothetical protein B0J11DRAFT_574453 [Dendryphion nanum]|uniref:Uncharacterized protein n=1 Tax=Dendryphion nanum TaxID=256645 RepID=A0A9P9EK13_9PLEO|nr:hypothetical protein B0J11DRAFT_574453 [Dendryphion nanum]
MTPRNVSLGHSSTGTKVCPILCADPIPEFYSQNEQFLHSKIPKSPMPGPLSKTTPHIQKHNTNLAISSFSPITNSGTVLIFGNEPSIPDISTYFSQSGMKALHKLGITDIAMPIPSNHQNEVDRVWGFRARSFLSENYTAMIEAAADVGIKIHAVGYRDEELSVNEDLLDDQTEIEKIGKRKDAMAMMIEDLMLEIPGLAVIVNREDLDDRIFVEMVGDVRDLHCVYFVGGVEREKEVVIREYVDMGVSTVQLPPVG